MPLVEFLTSVPIPSFLFRGLRFDEITIKILDAEYIHQRIHKIVEKECRGLGVENAIYRKEPELAKRDLKVEWIHADETTRKNVTVLYLHGG